MDDVLGYSRTFFIGGSYRAPEFPAFQAAIAHFHETLADVAKHIELGTELREVTPEILLQGPFSDAMTAGSLLGGWISDRLTQSIGKRIGRCGVAVFGIGFAALFYCVGFLVSAGLRVRGSSVGVRAAGGAT